MKRISYFIAEQQIEKLKNIKETTGLMVSEIIRRAIDEFIKNNYSKGN